jgi:CRP/FNR family cyclic AMP-dependent transcriptional regulator
MLNYPRIEDINHPVYNYCMRVCPSSLDQRLAVLRQCNYFENCGLEILQKLAAGMVLVQYDPGEVIFWQSEECRGLYILKAGKVKLYKLSSMGRELIIRILEPGASFNEVPIFDHGGNEVNVAAMEESEVWLIEKAILQQMARQSAELAQAVITNLTRNLRTLVRLVEEVSFYQVTNRLARLLVQLPEEQLSGTKTQRLTQDIMAARLGTVREVVARSLRDLDRCGAIRVRRGKIYILDMTLLNELAQRPNGPA